MEDRGVFQCKKKNSILLVKIGQYVTRPVKIVLQLTLRSQPSRVCVTLCRNKPILVHCDTAMRLFSKCTVLYVYIISLNPDVRNDSGALRNNIFMYKQFICKIERFRELVYLVSCVSEEQCPHSTTR